MHLVAGHRYAQIYRNKEMNINIEKRKRHLEARKCFALNAIKYVVMVFVVLQVPVSYAMNTMKFKTMTFNVGTNKGIAMNSDDTIHPDWDQDENLLGYEYEGIETEISEGFFDNNLAWRPAEENVNAFINRTKPEIVSFQELFNYLDCSDWNAVTGGYRYVYEYGDSSVATMQNYRDRLAQNKYKGEEDNVEKAILELLRNGAAGQHDFVCNRKSTAPNKHDLYELRIPQMKRILGDDYHYLWSETYPDLGIAVRKNFGEFINASPKEGLAGDKCKDNFKNSEDITTTECFLNDANIGSDGKINGRIAYIDIVPYFFDDSDPMNREIIRVIATHTPGGFSESGGMKPRQEYFRRIFKKGTLNKPAPIQYPNSSDIQRMESAGDRDIYMDNPRNHIIMGDLNTDYVYLCGEITPDDFVIMAKESDDGKWDTFVRGARSFLDPLGFTPLDADWDDPSACDLRDIITKGEIDKERLGGINGLDGPGGHKIPVGSGEPDGPFLISDVDIDEVTNVPAELTYDYIFGDTAEYLWRHEPKVYSRVVGNFDHKPVATDIYKPWSQYRYRVNNAGARFWGEYVGDIPELEIVKAKIQVTNTNSSIVISDCNVLDGVWDCEFDINEMPRNHQNEPTYGYHQAIIKYWSDSAYGEQPIAFNIYKCITDTLSNHARDESKVLVLGEPGDESYYAYDSESQSIGKPGDNLGTDRSATVSLEDRTYYYTDDREDYRKAVLWKKVDSCEIGIPDRSYRPGVRIEMADYNYYNNRLTVTGNAGSLNSEMLTDVQGLVVLPVNGITMSCNGTMQWRCESNIELPPDEYPVQISVLDANGVQASEAIMITIHAVEPEIFIETIQVNDSKVEINGTAKDLNNDLDKVSAFIPLPLGQLDLSCTGTKNWFCSSSVRLPEGEHFVGVNVVDRTGNNANAQQKFTLSDLSSIKINQNNSNLSISGVSAENTDSIIAELNGKAVMCDGSSLSNCEIDLSSIKEPGQYTVEVTVQSGNYMQTFTVPVNIDVDYIPIKVGNISIIVPKAKLVQ